MPCWIFVFASSWFVFGGSVIGGFGGGACRLCGAWLGFHPPNGRMGKACGISPFKNGGNILEGLEFRVGKWEHVGDIGLCECSHHIIEASNSQVSGGRNGHGDVVGKPGDSVSFAFTLGLPDPDSVAAVGI